MCLCGEFTGLDAPEPWHTTTMSGTMSILQQFANGLKSRSEETRAKAAKDLQHYVTMELREVSATNGIIYLCASSECRVMGWVPWQWRFFGIRRLVLVRRWGTAESLSLLPGM